MATLWVWLDRLTIVVSIVSAYFACKAWYRSSVIFEDNRRLVERRRAPILIRLATGEGKQRRTAELPYRPRRDQLSRQELTGLLSFYYGPERFDPTIVRRLLENGSLSRVLAGDLDASDADEVLEIEVDQKVFDTMERSIRSC